MSGYSLSRPAAIDLDQIWLALAQAENEGFATRSVEQIAGIFPMLAAMPDSGRMRSEIGPEVRSFPVDDYVIYYRKAKRGGVKIWRVIHGMRNQLKALRGPRTKG